IGALISAVFYWFGRDLIAYGLLAAATLIDLAIYGRLTDLTVCYRCHTEFRGAYQRSAPAFDLHTADVLEQEYERRIRRRLDRIGSEECDVDPRSLFDEPRSFRNLDVAVCVREAGDLTGALEGRMRHALCNPHRVNLMAVGWRFHTPGQREADGPRD